MVTENKEILKNVFFINFSSDEDDEIIEKGTYSVPFELKLPENKKENFFPSSCLLSESNIYIEIIYLLKAYILSDSKKIIKFSLPIMIRNYLEMFEYPSFFEEYIDVGTCCCERGLIRMIANVPYPNKNSYLYNKNNTNISNNSNQNNDLFTIGEKVGINICIDNEENKNNCEPISIKIYQKITLINSNLNTNFNNNISSKNFNTKNNSNSDYNKNNLPNNKSNNNSNNSNSNNPNYLNNSNKSKNTNLNNFSSSNNNNINTTYSDNDNIILYKCIGKFEHYKKIPKKKNISEKFFLYFKENIYTKDDDIKKSKYYKYIRHNLNYFSKLSCSVLSEIAKIEYYYEVNTYNDGWDYKELSVNIPFVMYPPEDIYKVLQKKINEFNDGEINRLNKQVFNVYFNSMNNSNKNNESSKTSNNKFEKYNINNNNDINNNDNNNNNNDNNNNNNDINNINNNININNININIDNNNNINNSNINKNNNNNNNNNNKIEMEINNSNVYNSVESSNRELFVNNKNLFINKNEKKKNNKKIRNFKINFVKNQINTYDII